MSEGNSVYPYQTPRFAEPGLCPHCFASFPAFIGHMDNCREASGSIYKQSTQKLSEPFFVFFFVFFFFLLGIRLLAHLSYAQNELL